MYIQFCHVYLVFQVAKVGNLIGCSFPTGGKSLNYLGNHVSKVGDCIGKVLATNKQTNAQCKY